MYVPSPTIECASDRLRPRDSRVAVEFKLDQALRLIDAAHARGKQRLLVRTVGSLNAMARPSPALCRRLVPEGGSPTLSRPPADADQQ